jgi:hypothetical protein
MHNEIAHQYRESNWIKQTNRLPKPNYPLLLCYICSHLELQNFSEPRSPETKRYNNTQLSSPIYKIKAWIHLHWLASEARTPLLMLSKLFNCNRLPIYHGQLAKGWVGYEISWYTCAYRVASTSHTTEYTETSRACKGSPPLIIYIYLLMVKGPSLDRSGTQHDSSDDPVTNIKDPGAHLTSGGSLSVLPQRATCMSKYYHI